MTARGGNVLVPKVTTSYTPQTSNTIVQFNTNVNHNMLVGQNIWVDVPVVGNPLTDAEYAITTVTDEDHMKIGYLPVNSNGGTYPKPSGSNNGVTIYPLVPPPLGRSGIVTINQSTFNLGSTDGTLTQSPLNAPTVFNFFFPDYKFPGTLSNNGLDSPEFQLTTDTERDEPDQQPDEHAHRHRRRERQPERASQLQQRQRHRGHGHRALHDQRQDRERWDPGA